MRSELLQRVQARLAESRAVVTQWSPYGELVITSVNDRWSILAIEKRIDDERTVAFLAQVCTDQEATARYILELAGELGAGSLALVGGSYVVRYCVPPAQIDATDHSLIARYVARLASSLREHVVASRTANAAAVAYLAL